MENEKHRKYSIDAFEKYENNKIDLIKQINISELEQKIDINYQMENIVYVLRLNADRKLDSSVLAIPNRHDKKNILYIGGHKQGVGGTRFIQLITSCRAAEKYFDKHNSAYNDKRHDHSVAGCLTTALLETGFRINDCIVDVFSGYPKYNELEFIIGYQEKYHHLPPWNSNRKGEQGFYSK